MSRKVVIFGIGDFASVACVYLEQDSPYEVAAFTAHQRFIRAPHLMGKPVVPFERLEEQFPPQQYDMFVAVGFTRLNKARAEIYDLCKRKGYTLISYVNSKAVHWGDIQIGDNCFILEQNVIQPFAVIGNDVIIWSGNHIGHHVTIGDHVFIASHAVISGKVSIGSHCFVGVNATIRDGVVVAQECVIGAAAVILKDTVKQGVYGVRSTEAAAFKSSKLKNF